MTTAEDYLSGRKKYQRPQAMLWSDNSGTLTENGFYIPNGAEIGSASYPSEDGSFIILSDDNREAIDFSLDRLERRERMINGRMRSYHIADKRRISTGWQMLPSRAYNTVANFNEETGLSELAGNRTAEFTTDGGAGGVSILDWYKQHTGSFWVFLAYDNYSNFGSDGEAYGNLGKYNEVVEVFFSDFSYSVQKRGGSNYDFWNISVTLEEV